MAQLSNKNFDTDYYAKIAIIIIVDAISVYSVLDRAGSFSSYKFECHTYMPISCAKSLIILYFLWIFVCRIAYKWVICRPLWFVFLFQFGTLVILLKVVRSLIWSS